MLVFRKHFSQVDVMTGMKRFSFLKFTGILGIFSGSLAIGFSQNSTNMAYQLANVIEDVRLLDERLRLMNAELEAMRRENTDLRRQLSSSQSQVDASMVKFATLANMNSAIADAVRQLEKRDDMMKDEIVLQVTKQIKEFALTVNKSIGKIPPAAAKPDPNIRRTFDNNYPQVGIEYVVQPGETLSKIAAKLNSKVDWIQNANTIADPRRVQAGRRLWIPQAE